nr:uncharacterized protein LOC109174453 [Ipomoea trifida]
MNFEDEADVVQFENVSVRQAKEDTIFYSIGSHFLGLVLQAIGSFLGVLVKTDERNFDSIRLFYLVRVSLIVSKPLRKEIELKKDVGE